VHADERPLPPEMGRDSLGHRDRRGVVALEWKCLKWPRLRRGSAGLEAAREIAWGALGRVVRAREIHPHRDHVIGSEARVEFKHPDKAAAKQPGANKKNNEKPLPYDENAAQAIVGNSARHARLPSGNGETVTSGSRVRARARRAPSGGDASVRARHASPERSPVPVAAAQAGGNEQAPPAPGQSQTERSAYEERQHASVKSCRTMRRRPAPSAMRMAISARLVTCRESRSWRRCAGNQEDEATRREA